MDFSFQGLFVRIRYRVAPAGFGPIGWKKPVLAAGAVQT